MSQAVLPVEFIAALPPAVRLNEPLAEHTTCRLGGPADAWLPVDSVEQFVEAVGLARQHGVPMHILGSGANLLISDAGLRGLVIQNRLEGVTFPSTEAAAPGDQLILTAASGVALPSLARRCARRGLSGFEWAVGVPGTIGGAVVNNAGAYEGDMARDLIEAELLSPAGERSWYPADWFAYGYRSSRLKRETGEPWLVLQARLGLTYAPPDMVQERINTFNQRRKASQPAGATLGSMFKNPPGDYAGRLIEAAGLKGHREGQAQISTVHANFFINLGGATASDFLALIAVARQAVQDQFSVTLELEIEVRGE